jgi:hypothetical protein
VHPIPDDVSHIPTEDIVRSARCEMRLGLLDQVEKVLRTEGVKYAPGDLLTKKSREKIKVSKSLNDKFETYGKVAIAYDFDFGITERNSADTGLAFKLPLASSVLDLTAGGSVSGTRVGQRTFKAQETFLELMNRGDALCGSFKPHNKNLAYPITGSIGLRKVVETFIAISEQGGGKDSFVDTLTFTTTVSGSLGSSIKIDPVSHSFRLVRADAGVAASRTDIHKVVISLAFPEKRKDPDEAKRRGTKKCDQDGICISDKDQEEYKLNPIWRARYNICVADARTREDTFKMLRDSPPEVYCIAHADAFVPRGADPRMMRALPPTWWR